MWVHFPLEGAGLFQFGNRACGAVRFCSRPIDVRNKKGLIFVTQIRDPRPQNVTLGMLNGLENQLNQARI